MSTDDEAVYNSGAQATPSYVDPLDFIARAKARALAPAARQRLREKRAALFADHSAVVCVCGEEVAKSKLAEHERDHLS